MRDPLLITDARFTPAFDAAIEDGLLGWVTCTVAGAIRIDGLSVRRTRSGEPRLSWPCRRDRAGREHSVVAPLDEATRLRLEEQVFEALGVKPGGRP